MNDKDYWSKVGGEAEEERLRKEKLHARLTSFERDVPIRAIQAMKNRKRVQGKRLVCTKCQLPKPVRAFWRALGGLKNRFAVCIDCFTKGRA